jgi:anti-sigma-K factor RskA
MTASEPGGAVPIACSLDAASLGERAGEWRALVASSVTAVEAGATAVRLVLAPSDSALTAAVALAQREKQCCAFFDVSLSVEADRRTLVLAVPEGAEDALAAFVGLLGS